MKDLEKSTEEHEGGRANQGAMMLLLWCRRAGAYRVSVMHRSMYMQL